MTVEELLVEEKIKFKQSPADFVVHCLNPEHDDTNPSMRIDKITGVFNCFSCGFNGNIFKHFHKPSNYLVTSTDLNNRYLLVTKKICSEMNIKKDQLETNPDVKYVSIHIIDKTC